MIHIYLISQLVKLNLYMKHPYKISIDTWIQTYLFNMEVERICTMDMDMKAVMIGIWHPICRMPYPLIHAACSSLVPSHILHPHTSELPSLRRRPHPSGNLLLEARLGAGVGGARATAMGRISPAALLTVVRRSPQLPPRGPMEELWAASMFGSS